MQHRYKTKIGSCYKSWILLKWLFLTVEIRTIALTGEKRSRWIVICGLRFEPQKTELSQIIIIIFVFIFCPKNWENVFFSGATRARSGVGGVYHFLSLYFVPKWMVRFSQIFCHNHMSNNAGLRAGTPPGLNSPSPSLSPPPTPSVLCLAGLE